jgi:mono/diheme cytochrome c family protein
LLLTLHCPSTIIFIMRAVRVFFFLAGAVILIAAAEGCAYAKKDVVQVPCVISDTVSYAKDIAPIISSNCFSCHSPASNTSGILLDSYDALKFWAENGYLYGTISHGVGYRPMPDGGGKLNDCTIGIIKKWIDKGTPQ